MLDVESFLGPDMFGMIQTNRNEIKEDELELIMNIFPLLFAIMQQHGKIPESVYDELGYPHDFEEGEIGVDRHVGIKKEHMQWAKHLRHPKQMKLRNVYKSSHNKKKTDQLEKAVEKERKVNQEIFDQNMQCEMKLLSMMQKHNDKVSKKKKKKDTDVLYDIKIKNADLKCFSGCNAFELKSFVHSRKFDYHEIPPNMAWTWPLRGSLAEFVSIMKGNDEKDDLITLAFQIKNSKIICQYNNDSNE
eukprot:15367170-Ditylum_brightwellii.AAC.1